MPSRRLESIRHGIELHRPQFIWNWFIGTNTPAPGIYPLWPRPIPLLIDTIFWATLLALLWLTARRLRRHLRTRRGHCPACNYNLSGLTQCPECGYAAATTAAEA